MRTVKIKLHSRSIIKQATLSLLVCLFSCSEEPDSTNPPKPDGFFDYEAFENDEKAKEYKRIYKENLYYAEGELDVDSIRQLHVEQHLSKRAARASAKVGVETLANGAIRGEWFERGPRNEAGDLREVDYDPTNDSLYVMSTAGSIFQGHLSGTKWRMVNDQIRFNTNVLNHVKKQGNDRLIACYGSGKNNKRPRYSDDGGQTWTLASGIGSEFYDGWGNPKKMLELSDGKTLYYLVHTWKGSPWGSAIQLYKSTNWGESYSLVLSMDGGGYDFNDVDMWKPEGEDVVYVFDNQDKKFYVVTTNLNNGSHNLSSPQTINGVDNGQVRLTGRFNGGNPTFYVLIGRNKVYKSNNSSGANWTYRGQVSIDGGVQNSFRNVFMANPFNNQLYMGGFQFYKSSDEVNWTEQYSYWWTYYDKNIPLPQRKDNMHVDMMEMEIFRKGDNTPFFIILNHAGIYVSYDNMQNTTNLGQDGLNVVTLYDHATAPDGTIFFGAQDKGTFSNTGNNNSNTNVIESVNQTTGDGMRELFFNNGQSWFGFLQNGSMYCMPNKNGNFRRNWSVPGDHIPGWINPVENHPDPSAKKCYVAGGNLNGGAGSYLILMEVSWTGANSNFQWNPTQFNYDFRANSRNGTSVIKALSASTADHSRLYVATNDGTFFTSYNAGSSWTRSNYNIPTSLRPWDIVVSATDADKVFLCGTGWSDTGVYMSENGGNSFVALDTEAPSATYFDMVLSPDETILYAATSEGPYAYVFADNRWYDISGVNAPFVDYRSVEYISSIHTVRFGTYGRGVWDLALEQNVVADCNGVVNGEAYLDYCDECVGGNTGNSPCQVPYSTHTIPGTIELEEFDYGGEGISYHDEDPENQGEVFRIDEPVDIDDVNGGGYCLGWTASDEWVEFTVEVEETGRYDIDYRMASPVTTGSFHLEIDDTPITPSVNVANTGGWQNWQEETIFGIDLTAGIHVLKFYIDNDGLNMDRLVFRRAVVTASEVSSFEEAILVYPNPARGEGFTVEVPSSSNVNVVDNKGVVIYKTYISSSKKINTSGWNPGTYLLEFNYNGKRIAKKVIVE